MASSSACENTDRSVPKGQVLAQQAVGVLVGAALPGGMRVGKVDTQARERGQLAMAGHLLALVVGQGESQRCRHRQQAKPSRAVSALASASLTSLRLVRSTSVPTEERLSAPLIRSPSQ